ncbi:peptidoglycan DD-metalloendopeptidase family protein [Paraflavitalea sp. CAU 1676]|uniref:peptidoglycan DD-metalloendopeptidase family protein n=1 Tax=Paraflavitalea sp. CAU 1676 TaxID=3032598 RepID=UPI0023D9DDFD|nr:peptidoglycan DD-metalloendopeptidase family protein [Paraflavitalea sp. CAU 1676]MDF2190876.1 peptidoglycan DD-metalloendopeptidase family protein [Paraflavitalea sp. CAU 1676]
MHKPSLVHPGILVLLLFVLTVTACKNRQQQATPPSSDTLAKTTSAAPAVPQRKFGLSVDSFTVIEKTIERNEFLANILELYQVEEPTIALLAAKSKKVFDIRNIRAGNQYTVFCTKDSLQKAQYFVYQPNAIDYVVYDLRDSISIYTGKREVTTRSLTASGKIEGSLYETFKKAGADPGLAMKLADIYAWSIDFYSIHEGDWFKVVYEQQYIKDEPVELGSIRSAVFSHDGEPFYAFFFQPDSTQPGEYYDEQGKTLRRFFLKAPLKFSHITSRFTLRRFHPVQKRWKAHLGTDYAAGTGTPIIATGNGVVIESAFSRFNGNYVKIRHNNTYTTQYLHMSRRAAKRGQHVRQGQVIGYVGSTGLATGPHVCYRFWKNNVQVDPLRQKFPSAEPISQSAQLVFDQYKQDQRQQLEAIRIEEIK